jgi:hypothetical protein
MTNPLQYYQEFLSWYQTLNSFYHDILSTILIGSALWLGKFSIPRLRKLSKKYTMRRDLGTLLRDQVRRKNLTKTDVRFLLDGYSLLISHSFRYFFYASSLLLLYWGVSALSNGNFFIALIVVIDILLLREAKMWLCDTPSEKEVETVDSELRKKVAEIFNNINYDPKTKETENKTDNAS